MHVSAWPQACEPLLEGGFPSVTNQAVCSPRARRLFLLYSVVLKFGKLYAGKDLYNFSVLCEKALVGQGVCKP